jgi:hypothetical protein
MFKQRLEDLDEFVGREVCIKQVMWLNKGSDGLLVAKSGVFEVGEKGVATRVVVYGFSLLPSWGHSEPRFSYG